MRILPLILILLCGFSAFAQSVLTNETIIEMVKSEISDAVIITKIKATATKFDTSPSALKALKDNKVSDAVQTAMIEKESPADLPAEPSKNELPTAPQEAPATSANHILQVVESPPFTPFSQLSKDERKQRLKQPAQIRIAAAKETVSSVIIDTMQGFGFSLQNESTNRLILQKKLTGMNAFLGQLAVGTRGGSEPMATYIFTLNELNSITSVTVDISMMSENVFGKTNRLDLNKNKKNREEADNILMQIKNRSER